MSTACYGLIVQEPSTTKNSSSSRAPKTGAQLRDNPEEREKCEKPPKNPSSPPTAWRLHSLHCGYPSLLRTGRSTNSGDELNLRHLPRAPDADLHNRDTVPPSEHCNCGTSTVFRSVQPHTPVVVQQRACERPCPRTARTVHCLDDPLNLQNNKQVNNLVQNCTCCTVWTETKTAQQRAVTNLSKNCTCGKYRTSCSTSTYQHDLWHWHTTICPSAAGTAGSPPHLHNLWC